MSQGASEKREERVDNIISNFKRIIDAWQEKRITTLGFQDDIDTYLEKHNRDAAISFQIIRSTVRGMRNSIRSPYFVMMDDVERFINIYYYVERSSYVSARRKDRMLDNILLAFREAAHYILKDQIHNEESRDQKFEDATLGLAGDAHKAYNDVMMQPVRKKLNQEEGDDDDDENAPATPDGDGASDAI